MRQQQRLGCGGDGALHQLERAVRHVDHDAERIAAADHLGAEIGQATMHRWLGLDVAELVGMIVRELELAQLPALVRLVDALDLAFEPVRTFGGHDHRRLARPRRAQVGGRLHDRHRLGARQLMQLGELDLAEIVELAGMRLADRPNAAALGADDRRVAHDTEADH